MAAGSLAPGSDATAWRERLAAEVGEPGPLLASGYGYEVFEARLEGSSDPVALKVFTSSVALHRRLSLLRMLEWRASFEHPHLLGVRGVGRVAGHPFLAMELLRAPTLADRLTLGAMEPGEAVQLLSGVAEAVDAAVAAGLRVRDLTPAAIVIDPVRGGVLGDLGVAAEVLGPVPAQLDDQLAYRSPEELPAIARGGRAATYSLGAVLYTALTAEPPHSNERLRAASPMTAPPPPVSSHGGDLPREIDAVVARAMAATPAARYGSACELMRAAAHALRGGAEARRRPGAVEGAAPPAQSRTRAAPRTTPPARPPTTPAPVRRMPVRAARPPERRAAPEPPRSVTRKRLPPGAPTPRPQPAREPSPPPAAPQRPERPTARAERKPHLGPKAPPRTAVAATGATRRAGALLRASANGGLSRSRATAALSSAAVSGTVSRAAAGGARARARAAGALSHALLAAPGLARHLRRAAPGLALTIAIAASAGLGLLLSGGGDPATQRPVSPAPSAVRPIVVEPDPNPALERLPATLDQLRGRRASALRRLERASLPGAQARAARGLRHAYRSAARVTAGAPELDRLRVALRRSAAAYSRLSRAAAARNRRGYRMAAARIGRSEQAVRRELAALR